MYELKEGHCVSLLNLGPDPLYITQAMESCKCSKTCMML